jgi:hypothetical protein
VLLPDPISLYSYDPLQDFILSGLRNSGCMAPALLPDLSCDLPGLPALAESRSNDPPFFQNLL